MAKKKPVKSETRKHTGMIRVGSAQLEKARLAASMMRMSLADYMTNMIDKYAQQDIEREAKKLTKGGKDS